MRCSTAHKLINPYIDGELNRSDGELLKTHLRECEKCGNEAQSLLNVKNSFAKVDKCNAPYGFSTRVMAHIKAEEAVKSTKLPLFVRFAEAFIFLIVILAGIFCGRLISSSLMYDRSSAIVSSLSLEAFDPAPAYSLGGSYLAMMEAKNEK
jgi:predicted anti-sigma-YlaC factor YlaD